MWRSRTKKRQGAQRSRRGSDASPFAIESLQQRLLLAGNILVEVVGGSLVITGDAMDNQLLIDQASTLQPDQYRVSAPHSTINGLTGEQVFTGVTKDIRVTMHDGNDEVSLSALTARNFHFKGGEGDNVVTLGNVDLRNVRITNGSGYDMATLQSVNIQNDVLIRHGAGGSETAVEEHGATGSGQYLSNIGGGFTLLSSAGDDRVGIFHTEVGGPLTLRDGEGYFDVRAAEFNVEGRTSIRGGVDDEYVSFFIGGFGALQLIGGSGDLDFEVQQADVSNNLIARTSGTEGSVYGRVAELSIGGNVQITRARYVDINVVDIGGQLRVRSDQASFDGELYRTTVAGRTSITTMNGDDELSAYESEFQGAFTIRTGNGNDTIFAQETVAAAPLTFTTSLRIFLGAGDDTLIFGSEHATSQALETLGPVRLDGGAGHDRLDHVGHVLNHLAIPTIVNFEETL